MQSQRQTNNCTLENSQDEIAERIMPLQARTQELDGRTGTVSKFDSQTRSFQQLRDFENGLLTDKKSINVPQVFGTNGGNNNGEQPVLILA